jgi:hypothetical protein
MLFSARSLMPGELLLHLADVWKKIERYPGTEDGS